MKLLRDECGVNSIRLRVWVNPTEGWNNIDNMVRHYRNSPSVVMWSIGNEVPFQNPEMKFFSGAATAIARSATQAGKLRFTVKAKGVKPATVEITVR